MELDPFVLPCGSTVNRISRVPKLQYKHLIVALLRDSEDGPSQQCIDFTYKFAKTHLGFKNAYLSGLDSSPYRSAPYFLCWPRTTRWPQQCISDSENLLQPSLMLGPQVELT
jgi:Protein of unknown function (DUF3435)